MIVAESGVTGKHTVYGVYFQLRDIAGIFFRDSTGDGRGTEGG